MFTPGDRLIFRQSKISPHPTTRAKNVRPSSKGDNYSYVVDKFWIVAGTLPGGEIIVQTRRGKRHVLSVDNPNLRRANWLERILFRHRFPQLDASATNAENTAEAKLS
ncbi:MAG: hypothetical protein MPJ50_11470 [Pirellulales bacterium]|nr:hypothetical protein [Pirellulales bacterium]